MVDPPEPIPDNMVEFTFENVRHRLNNRNATAAVGAADRF
jgi:hypothetical protein